MGKNMLRMLKFALKYPGWHSYDTDESTVRALKRLVDLGLVRTNKFRQFRIVMDRLDDERERAADEALYEWDQSRNGQMTGYENWEKKGNHWATSVKLKDGTTMHFSVGFIPGTTVVDGTTKYVKD